MVMAVNENRPRIQSGSLPIRAPIVHPILGDIEQSTTKSMVSPIHQGRPRAQRDSSSPVDFHDEWDPFETQRKSLHQKDLTVHLKMGIVEDVESLLEELSRLKRIGHFGAAEEYFEENLKRYIDIPPVLVEYADLMLEKGAYNTLSKLELKRKIGSKGLQTEYQMILDLIQCLTAIHSAGLLKRAETHVNKWERSLKAIFSRNDHLKSYEIQQIRYALEIVSLLEHDSCWVPELPWENIKDIYKLLLNEGRVWEARDILVVAAGMNKVDIRWIVDDVTLNAKSCYNFLQRWLTLSYDECTYLALLEVLAVFTCSIIYRNVPEPDPAEVDAARQFLKYARDLAVCIQRNTPEFIKSRPFTRWMLAEETMKRINHQSLFCLRTYLEKFPGLKVGSSPVPMYIPLTVETPGWPKPKSKDLLPYSEHFETLLKVSRELQDFRTEAVCLGEMIYRSPDPSDLLKQLLSLQRDGQQDILGFQGTCVSKFLIVKDDISCRSLLRDLNWAYSNGWHSPGCPLTDWSVIVVKRALERLWLQSEQHSSLSAAYKIANELPQLTRYELLTMRHEGVKTHRKGLPVSKSFDHEERIPIRPRAKTMEKEKCMKTEGTDGQPEDLLSNPDPEGPQPAAFEMEWPK